jgi:hypothetical protein
MKNSKDLEGSRLDLTEVLCWKFPCGIVDKPLPAIRTRETGKTLSLTKCEQTLPRVGRQIYNWTNLLGWTDS